MTPPGTAADVVTGLVLVATAAIAWTRRPQSRTGPLIALTGVTWLAGDVWGSLLYLHRGPLVHTLLTYPSGRTRSPLVIVVVALAYLDGLVPALARSPWPTLALGSAVVAVAAWRFLGAQGLERRAALVPLVGAVATWGALAVTAIGRLTDADLGGLAAWGYEVAVSLTAVALVADLASERLARAAATGLVIDLGSAREGAAGVRAAIARAVGDPGLTIFYRAVDGWVDDEGRPSPLPGADADRQVSTVEADDGTPVAAIAHDRAALRDETLARSVAAAVRLAVANVRLQADVATQVRELAASRRRLVEAGDVERRRLREQLAAGAEWRLDTVATELERLGDPALGDLLAELAAARDDLALFAQGVHPQALTNDGLPAALRALAAQSPLPIELDVQDVRLPAPQEAAAYFVCSEALANVAKYALASSARITVEADRERLRVQVTDDGAGGADPSAGSGLRGLVDRVEALGGSLSLDSRVGHGTAVAAVLPLVEPGAQ